MKHVEQKMESLKKYVPFIDYVLEIDQKKYIKFKNIRKWIVQGKKKYPLSDLNKIEQSIITQYKNLLIENNVRIPQNITNVFAPMKLNQFVNLCSDDEGEDEVKVSSIEPTIKILKDNNRDGNTSKTNSHPNIVDDSDDDLEFISIDYNNKTLKKVDQEVDIDEESKNILNKIDKLAADDIKMKTKHEPNNYTYQRNECDDQPLKEDDIFQRRQSTTAPDVLFKRRADFNDKEVELDSNAPRQIISLDSDSDIDVCEIGEKSPTGSNSDIIEIVLMETDKPVESTISNDKIANENVGSLCASIDSVLIDENELLHEVRVANDASVHTTDEQMPKEINGQETNAIPASEHTMNAAEILNLKPDQINEILENISKKSHLEWGTLYEAFLCVKQINSSPSNANLIAKNNNLDMDAANEKPPPAPPLSANVLPTPSVNSFSSLQQEQTQSVPPMAPHYNNNLNYTPNVAVTPPPPRPKININDPRIQKELQAIQNSPLFTYNILNQDVEKSIRKICEAKQLQLPHQQPQQKNSPAPSGCPGKSDGISSSTSYHKSSISYGEYKRRQLEKKLEMDRKRDEKERNAKAQAQQQTEKDNSKLAESSEEYIRSVLLSALKPNKEQISTLWNQQKNKIDSKSSDKTNQQGQKQAAKPNKGATNTDKEAKKSLDFKLNRVYSELKCTFKGFDNIRDFIPNETTEDSDTNSSKTNDVTARIIGLRRRSSMYALSAIAEQLGNLSSECSDPESQQQNNNSKRRKTIDEPIKPRPRVKSMRITSSNESLSDNEKIKITAKRPKPKSMTTMDNAEESSSENEKINNFSKNPTFKKPVVKLRRLTQNEIRKYGNKKKEAAGERSIKLTKTWEKVPNTMESVPKKLKLKRYNNDCQMTERNTDICVLCRSKPSDLTNHYIGRHKTESYISRLEWSELDDLTINTPFAKLLPVNKNYRFERYEVECVFCKAKLVDRFINFYSHYSAHTGEYAFQCSHCHYSKPYRPDIQSHILHSKACRNSSVQIMYRYPPQSQCIFLHYCTICNFTQLNEANVLKHLREHHSPAKATTSNVQKCILTAISDGPDANVVRTPAKEQVSTISTTEVNFKVDDDNVTVGNEPCVEDEFLDVESLPLEDQLKQMHDGPTITSKYLPNTIIHSMANNKADSPATSSTLQHSNLSAVQRHLPIIIKSESSVVEEKPIIMSPPKAVNHNQSSEVPNPQPTLANDCIVYEKYHSYPDNVSYFGLYKCMIGDCYYSTDCPEEMCQHLSEHISDDSKPREYLQCPYCILTVTTSVTPRQLVEHVSSQHGHLNFQCSLCCYRSCDASNVHIHQQVHHNSTTGLNTCKIYKCSSDDSKLSDYSKKISLYERIEKNVSKIFCKVCDTGFFYSQLLLNHLKSMHGIQNIQKLNIFSCIYCLHTVDNLDQIRLHVATKHPGEKPLVYDHNKHRGNNVEDNKSIVNALDVSLSVEYIEITSAINGGNKGNITQDVKPNVNELFMNEETSKIRLRKLTAHTGVSPNNLYRCADLQCSGFFSVFELWLKHMKVRHHTMECQCPHCPPTVLLPIELFSSHFEEHRLHTFICFHCSTTCPTEILAKQHAAQSHSNLGTMRFEKVHFNMNFAYSIMIQNDLLKDREKFIAELLIILDNRLKDLESKEIKKLKQQWLVRDNTPWIEDFLDCLSNRKVARPCLVKKCAFRTLRDENLYHHLRTCHQINGTQFNCSKCDFHVENCNSFDEICNHIKLHSEYIFICAACSVKTSSRTKMSTHIGEQHSARDVPVIHLFKTNQDMYIKVCIVFADNHLTFSTIKNCFCCSELNMSGDVLSLHLKRYHKFALNYYCEKCPNFCFKLLNDVKPHFKEVHNSINYKIRCELAGAHDLSVTSLNGFQIQIFSPDFSQQGMSGLLQIKNEPSDISDGDNVILLEDDDIIIQNDIRDGKTCPAPNTQPILKCTSLSKLLEPSVNTPPKLPYSSPSTSAANNHFIAINSDSQTPNTSFYNLDPYYKYTNIPMAKSLPLRPIAVPTSIASRPLVHNNSFASYYQPQNSYPPPQVCNINNIHNYTQPLPSIVYNRDQNYYVQTHPPNR